MASFQQDGVVVMGIPPDDPDLIPVHPPSGFVWITGGTWFGTSEGHGLAEMRVANNGETLDLTMTLADALSMRALLDQAIEVMREHGDVGEMP